MDGEPLWTAMYTMIQHLAPERRPREQFSDAVILGYGLWGALENKPLSWLAQTDRLPEALRRRAQRPSHSTLSRRLRQPAMLRLLEELWQGWLALLALGLSRVKVIDAMPLPVGFGSHDRTAKFGYGGGGKWRGYKLLAIIDAITGLIEDAMVVPMNHDEAKAAQQLIERIEPGTYLLGDAIYDKNHLYDAAGARGIQLIAPSKSRTRGLGHHRHSPYRLKAKRLLERPIGQKLMKLRGQIERQFGTMVTLHLGLTHLPAWIRGIGRVGRWCQFKIVSFIASRTEKQELTSMMQ